MIQNNQDLLSNDLEVSPTIQENLVTSAKWGKFLAIVGFITCILIILAGFVVAQELSSRRLYRYSGINPVMVAVAYIIMGIVFFFPCLFLFRFSTKMQDAARLLSQDSLESAIINLKAMFRFTGIFTIILISLYILAIVIAVAETS